MPVDGEVRELVVATDLINDEENLGIPISFGVGRKDRAVRLWGAKYSISGFTASAGVTLTWGFALSENPEHELAANRPTLVFAFSNEAIYAFHYARKGAFQFQQGEHGGGAYAFEDHTAHIPLYGILRPFRQIAMFWNESDAGVKMRAEFYYSPVSEGVIDLESLNRQKGAYRRT